MSTYSLVHLSDDAVSQQLVAATSADRQSTADHLARIAEFDRRELYLVAGCASMYRYCVDRLRMSEDVACHRIRAARVARAFPQVYAAVAEGRLNVTAVSLLSKRVLAKHVTRECGAELLAAAANRSNKQVLRLMAERFGPAMPVQQSATATCEPELSLSPASMRVTEPESPALMRVDGDDPPATSRVAEADAPSATAGGAPPGARPRRARLEPLGPGVFELVAELGQEAHDQLVASRELLGHAVRSGALIEVLERAIALQYAQLRKRRCGATDRPRTSANEGGAAPSGSANPRHVPDAVRRAVWERDGDRCAFTSADGHRCEERSQLELDHIVPVARGGASTVENLRLLCRAHNQYVAEREFGRPHMQGVREAARRRRAEERASKQADRERTERRKAEIARQRQELGEAFRQLGYRGRSLEIALAYCASRAEASLEERLKYALGCMAPRAHREAPASAEAAWAP